MATPQRRTNPPRDESSNKPSFTNDNHHTIVQNRLFAHDVDSDANYEEVRVHDTAVPKAVPHQDHRRQTLRRHPILDADGYVASSDVIPHRDQFDFDQTSSTHAPREGDHANHEEPLPPTPIVKSVRVGSPKKCGSACLQVGLTFPNLWGLAGHGDGESRFIESAGVTAKLQAHLHYFDLIVGTLVVVVIAVVALVLASIATGNTPDDDNNVFATIPSSSLDLQQNLSALQARFKTQEAIIQQQAKLIQLLNDTNDEQATQIQRINEQLEQLMANSPTTSYGSSDSMPPSTTTPRPSFSTTPVHTTTVTSTSFSTVSPSPIPSLAPSFSSTSANPYTSVLSTSAPQMALEQVVANLVKNMSTLLALNELNKDIAQPAHFDIPNSLVETYALIKIAFAYKKLLGQFKVYSNSYLRDISGFTSLESVGNIIIANNPLLLEITGFTSLKSVDLHIQIGSNTNLVNISGFTSLTTIQGSLHIYDNPKLTNFEGLRNVNCVRGGILLDSPAKNCQNCPQWLIDVVTRTKGKC
eukprot:m.171410 g.171410  ORF g.171410 m.171410 type:complete len:527 (-) comp31648_c1_seq8:166-1746(-)